MAQVWRKLLLSKSRNLRQTCATKPTCAKPAPNQLAPNLRHHLRHHLRHRPLTPPLAPNQGGASTKLFTPNFVHQHVSTTTNLRHHLRQTPLAPNSSGASTTLVCSDPGQKARRGPKDIQLNPALRGGIDREGGQTLFMGGASI